MSKTDKKTRSRLHTAFRRGMLLALGVAFVPLAIISIGLFLSGYQPTDFDVNLRYGLVGLWLLYVFSADRIASLDFWRRVPFLRGSNPGEAITIVAFAGLIATLRIGGGIPWYVALYQWLVGFAVLSALFLGLYLVFRSVTRSWRRAAQRSRNRKQGVHFG